MDPRQRAVDRRRFTKIAVMFVVGLVLGGIALALFLLVPEDIRNERSGPTRGPDSLSEALGSVIVVGAVLMVVAVGDLVVRWVRGPQKPGKRARD
ncbi:hypothetical protein [Nocardioides aromaticivorans]|uniref:hypothetical protein n=1 Tax=Nocardioides aromaticivorans TaxID=200618 RepID=UPI001A8E7398|nr:hypothetical protein [Nocardioides aromaticivorans]